MCVGLMSPAVSNHITDKLFLSLIALKSSLKGQQISPRQLNAYKIKYLISITPAGAISLISEGWERGEGENL